MTKLLNLPGVIVENLKETPETLILKIKNLKKKQSVLAQNYQLTDEEIWSMVKMLALGH